MAVQEKYQSLIDLAQKKGVTGLKVHEQEGVLYVSGTAPNTEVKEAVWQIYESIDPEMKTGDLVLDIAQAGSITEQQTYLVKPGDSLGTIAKLYPGLTWNAIFEANKDTIRDPNLIHPGQKLKIP
ncbi:LysM domain-containing protein [Chitinophaga costaii]|uniref:LysM domain-containing protein n=1 Tax=Chitinophaga costaii TaxID=1335309 RepID=A0A1C4FRK3_9BACT|nr:LysM peptidoglycan-binding domain-containing protein [Chitinophaga costaii]PUZ20482.1 LysM peptidoglycan-binding domain-containing protein [Chitinophaga costaii]SCC58444.1 LysM domain-containing protein [Chitinophaga costaii]